MDKIFAIKKEIKQDWTGTETFNKCSCVVFNSHYKSFISETKTGH